MANKEKKVSRFTFSNNPEEKVMLEQREPAPKAPKKNEKIAAPSKTGTPPPTEIEQLKKRIQTLEAALKQRKEPADDSDWKQGMEQRLAELEQRLTDMPKQEAPDTAQWDNWFSEKNRAA